MGIAIDCRMIGSGGIGTYISSLIPHFLEKEQCLLVGRAEDIAKWKDHPNAVLCPCEVKMFSAREMLFFPRRVRALVNKCSAYYSPYCSVPSGIHVSLFLTIHDVVFLDVKGLCSSLGRALRKALYKRAVRRTKVLFTVSEFSASRIRETLGVRNKTIVVAHDALPDWFDKGSIAEAGRQFGQCGEIASKKILFVGNIKKHKGLAALLKAFALARARGLDALLCIVGAADGFRTRDDSIKSTLEGMEDRGAVRFMGKVSDEALFDLYREAALLVQPSVYEGFGLPPLEALSLGTPVIVSDIPVFREIYDGLPVTYFTVGDSADLCEKMLQAMSAQGQCGEAASKSECALDVAEINKAIKQKYSFLRSAAVILQTIGRFVSTKAVALLAAAAFLAAMPLQAEAGQAKTHKWYAFVDGNVKRIESPKHCPHMGMKRWTLAVRVSGMGAADGKVYILANRLGMIEISSSGEMTLMQDVSVFSSSTVQRMAFCGGRPVFLVQGAKVSGVMMLDGGLFFPIVTSGKGEIVDYVWQNGKKALFCVKNDRDKNSLYDEAFSYFEQEGILPAAAQPRSIAQLSVAAAKTEYRTARMMQSFSHAPKELQSLLSHLQGVFPFIVSLTREGGGTEEGFFCADSAASLMTSSSAFVDERRVCVLFPDGTTYMNAAGRKEAFRLPLLPDGFSYTAVAIAGDYLYAAYEENDMDKTARSGFIQVKLSALQ